MTPECSYFINKKKVVDKYSGNIQCVLGDDNHGGTRLIFEFAREAEKFRQTMTEANHALPITLSQDENGLLTYYNPDAVETSGILSIAEGEVPQGVELRLTGDEITYYEGQYVRYDFSDHYEEL